MMEGTYKTVGVVQLRTDANLRDVREAIAKELDASLATPDAFHFLTIIELVAVVVKVRQSMPRRVRTLP